MLADQKAPREPGSQHQHTAAVSRPTCNLPARLIAAWLANPGLQTSEAPASPCDRTHIPGYAGQPPTNSPVSWAISMTTLATACANLQSGSAGKANVQLVLVVAVMICGMTLRCAGSLLLPNDTKGTPWRAARPSSSTALATMTSSREVEACWQGSLVVLDAARNSGKGCVAMRTVCTS